MYCSRFTVVNSNLMESLLAVKNSRSAFVIEPWGAMLFRFTLVSGYCGRNYVMQNGSFSDYVVFYRNYCYRNTSSRPITKILLQYTFVDI